MTTKDLLKLSPEGKKEVWFEKFLGFEYIRGGVKSLRGYAPALYRHPKSGIEFYDVPVPHGKASPNILDSLSAWIEYVEKPMGEMGWEFFIHRSFMTKEIAWAGWTRRGEDSRDYESKIQNGKIFLTSLDAAFHIPKVLEKING